MTLPFRAARHNFDNNHRTSIGANVRPAVIEAPHGKEEPGVMIGNGDRVVFVLTRNDAYRIAKDIADVLTNQRAQARQ